MNASDINTSLSFKDHIIYQMAEHGLSITPTDNLEGEDLSEAEKNNEGLRELFEILSTIHNLYVSKAASKPSAEVKVKPTEKPKPKVTRARAKKEPTEKPKDAAAETEPTEEKPKTKTTRAKKQPTETDAPAEPKPKRAPTQYALFTATVTDAAKTLSKGEQPTGWEDTSVTVQLDEAKVTEKMAPILAHEEAKKLLNLKGTKQTMAALLKISTELLAAATGKTHAMTLTSLLWSATGNVNPFVVVA
jgi:outer membrane biosynthesis protein TonB